MKKIVELPAIQSLVLGVNLMLYLRSSSDEQPRSVGQQFHSIRDAFTVEGRPVSGWPSVGAHAPEAGVYVDDGVSGWKFEPDERPSCKALVEWCERHPRDPETDPGYILVWDLSRFGRFKMAASAAIYWLHRMKRAGWIVHSLTEPLISRIDDENRLFAIITVALKAEGDTKSSEDKSVDVARGKRDARSSGYWGSGEAPYGYTRWAARPGPTPDKFEFIEELGERKRNVYRGNKADVIITTLVPNSDAYWVEQCYQWMDQGISGQSVSINEVVRHLNSLVLKDASGSVSGPVPPTGEEWSRSTVRKILSNRVYRGLHPGPGEEARGVWKPIVDDDLWHRVQTRLARNRSRGRSANSSYVLAGMLRCARCAAAFHGNREKSGNGHVLYYRAASVKLAADRCPACCRRLSAEVVERAVLEAVQAVADEAVVQEAVAVEEALGKAGMDAVRARLREIDQKIREIEAKIDNIFDLVGAGAEDGVGRLAQSSTAYKRAQSRLAKLDREIDALTKERLRLQGGQPGDAARQFQEDARRFAQIFSRATCAEKKDLLECFVDRIEIDGEQRTVAVGIRSLEGYVKRRDQLLSFNAAA